MPIQMQIYLLFTQYRHVPLVLQMRLVVTKINHAVMVWDSRVSCLPPPKPDTPATTLIFAEDL